MLGVIILIFALGIFLENKIRKYVSEKEVVLENEMAVVKRVIDGDTIELNDGRSLRYIGINAPEMTDKRPEVLCLAQLARAENQRLVEGKTVELEKDINDKDKYDRLLRYVWINGEMVNITLVKNGFASTATYPPDIKYKDEILQAEKSSTKVTCSKI